MWYRVFCRSMEEPRPDALAVVFREQGVSVNAKFRGDDLGWTGVEFTLDRGSPIFVERYDSGADDLREDLNTWAGYLETLTYSPNHTQLMEHVIQSRQLVTIRKPVDYPNEVLIDRLCDLLCRAIALAADGIYQIESVGWFSGQGERLIEEY